MKLQIPVLDPNRPERWMREVSSVLSNARFFNMPKGAVVLYHGTVPPQGWVAVTGGLAATAPAGCLYIAREDLVIDTPAGAVADRVPGGPLEPGGGNLELIIEPTVDTYVNQEYSSSSYGTLGYFVQAYDPPDRCRFGVSYSLATLLTGDAIVSAIWAINVENIYQQPTIELHELLSGGAGFSNGSTYDNWNGVGWNEAWIGGLVASHAAQAGQVDVPFNESGLTLLRNNKGGTVIFAGMSTDGLPFGNNVKITSKEGTYAPKLKVTVYRE